MARRVGRARAMARAGCHPCQRRRRNGRRRWPTTRWIGCGQDQQPGRAEARRRRCNGHPAAQNWKGSEASITRADGKSRMDILHYRAEQGFTRPAPAITPDGLRSSPHAPISRPLWASMIASHGRVVSRRILKGRSRRRLNPLFVGWLMGWPIGHALCACSATEFTLWQQHMRGALSQLPMASGPWIWRPTDQAQRPAQMSLFEGMQP